MLAWLAAARAAEPSPVVHLVVTSPAGDVALDETLPLPVDRTIPGEGHALGIFVAPYGDHHAVVQLVTGKLRGEHPKPRNSGTLDLTPFLPYAMTVEWKDLEWKVLATFGTTWTAPPPEPGVGGCDAPGDGPRTTRALSATLEDGTAYAIAPGVPAELLGGGLARIRAGDLSLVVGATEEDVGPAVLDPARKVWGPPDPVPRSLEPGVVGRTALGDVEWSGEAPLPIAEQAAVDAPIVEVRVPCASVRMHPNPYAQVLAW